MKYIIGVHPHPPPRAAWATRQSRYWDRDPAEPKARRREGPAHAATRHASRPGPRQCSCVRTARALSLAAGASSRERLQPRTARHVPACPPPTPLPHARSRAWAALYILPPKSKGRPRAPREKTSRSKVIAGHHTLRPSHSAFSSISTSAPQPGSASAAPRQRPRRPPEPASRPST